VKLGNGAWPIFLTSPTLDHLNNVEVENSWFPSSAEFQFLRSRDTRRSSEKTTRQTPV